MKNIEVKNINGEDNILFIPEGVCCQQMFLKVKDDIIQDAKFFGGCNGNLQGICHLIIGHNVDEISQKLKGICCGAKQTSCPDQLSKCIEAYKDVKTNILVQTK